LAPRGRFPGPSPTIPASPSTVGCQPGAISLWLGDPCRRHGHTGSRRRTGLDIACHGARMGCIKAMSNRARRRCPPTAAAEALLFPLASYAPRPLWASLPTWIRPRMATGFDPRPAKAAAHACRNGLIQPQRLHARLDPPSIGPYVTLAESCRCQQTSRGRHTTHLCSPLKSRRSAFEGQHPQAPEEATAPASGQVR
jgi:hypothetical protein